MLEKLTVTNQINVREDGQIEVQEATYIVEDGVRLLNPSYHRYVVVPGDSVADVRVMQVAAVIHTPEVISAYQVAKEAERLVRLSQR